MHTGNKMSNGRYNIGRGWEWAPQIYCARSIAEVSTGLVGECSAQAVPVAMPMSEATDVHAEVAPHSEPQQVPVHALQMLL
jgi:hypothetical protein